MKMKSLPGLFFYCFSEMDIFIFMLTVKKDINERERGKDKVLYNS